MAIVINGSGTVTGISVGGLPDGTVDAGTLATDSVDSAEIVDGSVDRSKLNTSIADSGNATAITIDSSENVALAGANLTMTDGSLKSGVSGTFNINGATGTAGSAAYCTYGFNGDVNTGMYSGTADTIKFATGGTEHMRIDATGAVTKPLQPAFSVYNSANQDNIGTGWTTVNMNTEIFDQNADFNTGTYTFTAPVTGKYLLTANVCTKDMHNDVQWYMTGIETSNRSYQGSRSTGQWDAAANGFALAVPITAVADMDASDTATVRVYRYTGTAQGDIMNNGEYTFFHGYLLG